MKTKKIISVESVGEREVFDICTAENVYIQELLIMQAMYHAMILEAYIS